MPEPVGVAVKMKMKNEKKTNHSIVIGFGHRHRVGELSQPGAFRSAQGPEKLPYLYPMEQMMKKTILLWICFCWASFSAMAQVDTVVFSVQGGFYDDVIQLDLFNYYAQNHIHYTTNGNSPDADSPLYTGSLTLDNTLYSGSNIYTIVNTIPSIFYLPDSIQHAIVIRAAVFDDQGNRLCQPVTNTYFIHSLGCDFHGLPVMALTADSLALFDYETGIFVPGIHYDPADSTHTGNFKMRGREWERVVNVEFYEPDNQGINQRCGLRTHGGASRYFQQKGMKLYAREEYGKKRFSFPFFSTTTVNKFKHLCLHPFRCSHWLQNGGQEYLSQTIARHLNFESLAVRETVVFINGEYWGIYTLEEAPDERFIENHFEIDLEELAMIKYWGVPYYGDPTDWRNLYQWMQTADLTQPDDWAYANEHVDVSCFLDYMLFESFSGNLDWPTNNVKLWQPKAGDRFRWLFYDGDGCFTRPAYNATEHALNVEGNSMVYIHFRENQEFLQTFCDRYFELCETYFSYDYMKSVLDEYAQTVEEEVPAQSYRFQFPADMNRWTEDMGKADAFLRQRDFYFRQELDAYFTGLDLLHAENAAYCYPNPFSDEIKVVMKGDTSCVDEIVIYDLTGRKMLSMPFKGTDNNSGIRLQPQLAAGVYLLKAGPFVQRIVKK